MMSYSLYTIPILGYGALEVSYKIGGAHVHGALRTGCLSSFLVIESLIRDDDSAAFQKSFGSLKV